MIKYINLDIGSTGIEIIFSDGASKKTLNFKAIESIYYHINAYTSETCFIGIQLNSGDYLDYSDICVKDGKVLYDVISNYLKNNSNYPYPCT